LQLAFENENAKIPHISTRSCKNRPCAFFDQFIYIRRQNMKDVIKVSTVAFNAKWGEKET